MKDNSYLQFLRYSLDEVQELPESAKSIDWKAMMAWAERQSIVGIIFGGIQKADKASEIPFEVLMKWIGDANLIENRNKLLNNRCVEVVEYFRTEGFESCILKGQGNAILYDVRGKKEDGRSLALLRTPGDIDVWVRPKSDVRCKKEDVKRVIWFAREKNPRAKACYHHVDYGAFNGVEVEMHYRPSFMFNPLHNNHLQRWLMVHGEGFMVDLPEGAGKIQIPNWEFNIIFQLSHVYNHLLHEGIGLRQLVDYYYLLRSDGRSKMDDVSNTLRYLGLDKIAGAMMWMLNEVLGLPEEYLIAPKDEKRGKILLTEIMKGGNLGHYDAENQKANSAIKRNLQRIKRDMRMMRYFPSECMWEPVFRVYHYFWRQKYK